MGQMRSLVARLNPGALARVSTLRGYQRQLLRPDLVAALAVTALMIPHGMAYAELAGVPAVTGLYTTIAALIAYAVFGPSRLLLLGPDSSLAPLIAAAILLAATPSDPQEAIAVAGMLALLTGGLCIIVGLSRLGSIAELLSRPVELGYLNGLAIVMVVSQAAKLCGFSVDAETTPGEVVDWVSGVSDGLVNGWSLGVGLVALVLIVAFARVRPAVPGVLLAVAVAMLAVSVFDLRDRGVDTVGTLPSGFPRPTWPGVELGSVWSLTLAAVGLAWVTLSDTTALSRGFAARTGDRVDPNREIIALGVANIAAGLFRGFPVSASTSRTTTAHSSGGKTQMVGVVAAALILVLVVLGGDIVSTLPSTALAAIVIAAAIKLFDLAQVKWLYRARRSEFFLCLAATVGVVAVGVLNGIAVAVALSLANFIRRVWRPYDAVLGRVERRKGYHDRARHPDAREVPGLILFRFDAPLFFANADHFARRIEQVVAASPTKVRRIVVAAEPITDIDTSAAAMLATLIPDLRSRGVEFAFAELKGPVKDRLVAYGLLEEIAGADHYPTIGSAVRDYVDDHAVEWTNWDEK